MEMADSGSGVKLRTITLTVALKVLFVTVIVALPSALANTRPSGDPKFAIIKSLDA